MEHSRTPGEADPTAGRRRVDVAPDIAGSVAGEEHAPTWLLAPVLVVGLTVLVVGWWGGVEVVTRVHPSLVSMKANTALGFVLAGVALHPWTRRSVPVVASAAAGLLGLIGTLSLLEHLLGTSFGIDQLLAVDRGPSPGAPPGLMGANTALAFAALGPAIVLSDRRRGRPARLVAQLLATLTGLLGLLALLGYLFGARPATGLGSATEMALHTSVLVVLTAAAVLIRCSDVGPLSVTVGDGVTARLSRRLLPTAAAGVTVGALVVELVARTSWLDDGRLQLALQAVVAMVVVVVALLLVLRDMAAAEAVVERVRRDHAALRAAFPDVFARIGVDGVVVAVDGDDPRLLDRAVGRPLADVLPPGAAQVTLEALRRAAEDRETVTFTFHDLHGRTQEARLVPLGDAEVAVALRDVSELARTQQRLADLATHLERTVEQRTAELKASNRELERFAYLASHDMQEPLRMVTGFVGKIEEKYADLLDERGRTYVHYAVDGAKRMSALIEGLLQYSRAGALDPDRVGPASLGPLVRQVLQSLAGAIADADATVDLQDEGGVADGDPTLLRQVVQNLLTNALKFHRPDVAPAVLVRVEDHPEDAQVHLVVQDNGIGIDPDQRDEAFQMFRRLSVDPAHRGTGIGLSLVQQMVNAHGGTIEVTDALDGPGTRFTIRLPRAEEVPA